MASWSVKPTKKIAANAKLGLELRERFNRGGTDIGVNRARQLVAQERLSPGRHQVHVQLFRPS